MPHPAPAIVSPRLTKKQAADYIPCSIRTLDRLKIPRIRVPGTNKVLFEREAIDAWLRSQQKPGA